MGTRNAPEWVSWRGQGDDFFQAKLLDMITWSVAEGGMERGKRWDHVLGGFCLPDLAWSPFYILRAKEGCSFLAEVPWLPK